MIQRILFHFFHKFYNNLYHEVTEQYFRTHPGQYKWSAAIYNRIQWHYKIFTHQYVSVPSVHLPRDHQSDSCSELRLHSYHVISSMGSFAAKLQQSIFSTRLIWDWVYIYFHVHQEVSISIWFLLSLCTKSLLLLSYFLILLIRVVIFLHINIKCINLG